MSTALRWTSADLEVLPDDGKRYEIIEGELYMSRQPHYHHQKACGRIYRKLDDWSLQTKLGDTVFAPGVIFDEDDDVAPDVAWTSFARLDTALQDDGKLHSAPDLAIEVLSFGTANERRDRQVKLKLYSQRGVQEYWIANWRTRQIEVYRRSDAALELVATLFAEDTLTSPLLPGFEIRVASIFED